MHKKILYKFNLYEKYNKLVTEEGKKIFLRTVYTLSICTVVIVFTWYCGIASLASKNPKGFLQQDVLKSSVNKTKQNITMSAKTDTDSQVKKIAPTPPENLTSTTGAAINLQDLNKPPATEQNKNSKHVKNNDKKQEAVKKPDALKIAPGKGPEKVQKTKDIQKTIYKGENKPYVALTFDDGYNRKTIIKVLDILKKNNVKATFFIIGRVLDDYPEVWKRAINEGHEICNHTLNHPTLMKLKDQQVRSEIIGWETYVKKTLGEEYLTRMKRDFPYLRLPGGNGNKSDRILEIAQSCGYKVVGWNLETNSSVINQMRNTHTAAEIADKVQRHVVNNCSKGSIILLHFNEYDVTNLEEIIVGINKRGYGFQTVTEVLKNN